MATLILPIPSATIDAPRRGLLFPGAVGFFFVFRAALTFLFFQASPVTGTVVTVLTDLALVYGTLLWSAGASSRADVGLLQAAPVRWILALLIFWLVSVLWTGAQSMVAALAYWVGMAADVAAVLLMLRRGDVQCCAENMMKGAVWGGAALALVGWCSPVTADLRLGNDLFLHPNTLGLELGIATLIAQYFAPRGALWRWAAIGLAITLLRTLSKTSIVAFVVAECWYLAQSRQWTRAAKMRIGAAALLVVACFWGVLSSYVDIYSSAGSGDQLETLTGRTLLWTVTFSMGMERPWFGHGLYSFKSLVPALGDFEPVHAHNELLQQFFEFGMVGVALVVGVYWAFLRHAWRAPASELRTLALALWIFAVVRGLSDTREHRDVLPAVAVGGVGDLLERLLHRGGLREMTQISIVTPSLNQGRFLGEALDSVCAQGRGDVEHLVFDGGSTDETVELLKSLDGQQGWSHVRWQSAPDAGQSDALNHGFAQAQGEIVGWLNSDDRYRPGCFDRVVRAFAEHPEVDVFYGNVAEIDEDGDLLRVRREIGFNRFVLLYHHVLYIPTPATFFRRRIFEDGNRLRPELHYAMDYEFFLRLAGKGYRIRRIPKVLAEFRVHPASKSYRMEKVQAEEKQQILWSKSPIGGGTRLRRTRLAALFLLQLAAGVSRRCWKLARGDYFRAHPALMKKGEV